MGQFDFHNDPQPSVNNEGEPWRRQPWEDDDVWLAYRSYLMQPAPRTLGPVVAVSRKPLSWVRDASRGGYWQARVKAWDDMLAGKWFDAAKEHVETHAVDVAKQHLATITELSEIAKRETAKLLEASRSSQGFGLLRPGELIKLIEKSVQLYRLLGGESTSTVQVNTDLTKVMSIAEIKLLAELQAKAVQ